MIGYLSGDSPVASEAYVAAFRRGLGEVGFVEGQSVAIEYRWADSNFDRLPALAADLVKRRVDLIVTSGGGVPVARAAKNASPTIPIVFISGDDPVAAGLVANHARPGGNLTGLSFLIVELTPKRFELLRELVPKARVIGLLVPTHRRPASEQIMREVQEAARLSGVRLEILKAGTDSEIDAAFAALTRSQAGALVVDADPFFNRPRQRELIVALAARHAIPTVSAFREFALAGGLMSYGASLTNAFRELGVYAGRVLKGARPADLPVEQPTMFEMSLNLTTAKALGLAIPPSILARADEVIE